MFERTLTKLRDDIWQFIGVVVTLAVAIISVFVAYDIYVKSNRPANNTDLKIRETYVYQPFRAPNTEPERVQIWVDGEWVDNLYVQGVDIANLGETSITPENYEEPIEVTVRAPWSILLIDTAYTYPPDEMGTVQWTEITTDTFQMAKKHLNAGDIIGTAIYIVHDQEEDWFETPEFIWSGRIDNVASIIPREDSMANGGVLQHYFLGVSVHHDAPAIYAWIFISVTLGFGVIAVAKASGRIKDVSASTLLAFSVIALLSFISGEVLADMIFTNESIEYPGNRQAPIALTLVGIYIVIILVIGWPAIIRLANWLIYKLQRSNQELP